MLNFSTITDYLDDLEYLANATKIAATPCGTIRA